MSQKMPDPYEQSPGTALPLAPQIAAMSEHAKLISYLEQENSVLHSKLRSLEMKLEKAERELRQATSLGTSWTEAECEEAAGHLVDWLVANDLQIDAEGREAICHNISETIREAIADERRACAKVAEEYAGHWSKIRYVTPPDCIDAANSIAQLIRGRGEK
jgi:hypothetical protein